MNYTLHYKLRQAEEFKGDLEKAQSYLHSIPYDKDLIISKTQEGIMRGYEKNSLFKEAILGNKSITESLEELAQVNKGYRKWLPRRKDKIQNERVKQIGELIDEPYQLTSNGIFYPDNFTTATVEMGSSIILVTPIIVHIISQAATTPKDAESVMQFTKVAEIFAPLYALAAGSGLGKRRFKKPPHDQAKYLDEKIAEFYK